MDKIIIILITIVTVYVTMQWITKVLKTRWKRNLLKAMEEIDDINISHCYLQENGNKGIAIDDKNERIVLVFRDLAKEESMTADEMVTENVTTNVLHCEDISELKIIENPDTILKAFSNSKANANVTSEVMAASDFDYHKNIPGDNKSIIELQLFTNNQNQPAYAITFLRGKVQNRNSSSYKEALKSAQYWYDNISALIVKSQQTQEHK